MKRRFTWKIGMLVCLLILPGLLSAALAVPARPSAEQGGKFPDYLPVKGWPTLPENLKLGAVSAVATDSTDQVFVFHRGKQPVLVFDKEGKFLRSWGDEHIKSAHGLRIDHDNNVWLTDTGNHQVLKFDAAGKLLLALGVKGQPGDSPDRFDRPTDVAFAANGDFYVSDGYGNSRVLKFSKDGKLLKQWGKKGAGPGEFNLPHAICVDAAGKVYVGDRENNRIQVFDADGRFLAEWKASGTPFGLFLTSEGQMFVADGQANLVRVLDREGKVLGRWGSGGSGPGQFALPHMLCVDSRGAVYVAEVDGSRVQKFIAKSPPPETAKQLDTKSLVLGAGPDAVKMEFVRIPKGKFLMGSPKSEKAGKKDNEEKQHEVEITRDFYLGKYEVTLGLFAQFIRETNYKTDAEKAKNGGEGFNVETGKDEFKAEYNWRNVGFPQTEDHPVVIVSWFDAVKFCEWLSQKTGKAARLPTEAEWEYACRAGTATRFHSGDDNESRVKFGNLADAAYSKKYPKSSATKGDDGYVFTAPVGQFKVNAFGLHDMHGNVYEWCEDWFGPIYSELSLKDPLRAEKAGNANLKVIRGGAWQTGPDDGYSAARHRHAPAIGYSRTGFRVLVRAD